MFSGIFCSAEGIADILKASGCVELVFEAMASDRKDHELQVKSLITLQNLITSPERVMDILIPEIKKVMELYPKAREVQQQCCEMLYVLARPNYAVSVTLVKNRLHELFFNILATFDDDIVLNNAADCIYLLACENDLKNPMLLEMCALGNTTAVGLLLQLSADVNYAEGSDTPLSVACTANKLELVQLLLEKGITDMHHPLTLCLENKHRYKLAGFLLKRMGHDEDAGTISLTGDTERNVFCIDEGGPTSSNISSQSTSSQSSLVI